MKFKWSVPAIAGDEHFSKSATLNFFHYCSAKTKLCVLKSVLLNQMPTYSLKIILSLYIR